MDHGHTPLDDRNNLQLPGMSAVQTMKMKRTEISVSRQMKFQSTIRTNWSLLEKSYVVCRVAQQPCHCWSPCPNWAISQQASNFQSRIFYNREKCRPPVFCVGFKWPIFHGKLYLVMGPPGSWAKWVLNTHSPLIWWILDCFDMCRVIVQGVITLSNKDNQLYSQGRWYRAGAMCCQTSRAGMKLSRERLREFLSICSPYL